MTDRRELEALIAKAREAGATVTVVPVVDDEQRIDTIIVHGIKGVGPYPMSPISFAERMREVLR